MMDCLELEFVPKTNVDLLLLEDDEHKCVVKDRLVRSVL